MVKANPEALLKKLGPAEKAALRLLIDISGPSLRNHEEKLFSRYPWGGVILFPKNIRNKEEVRELIRRLQTLNKRFLPRHPLFISVDQEGGSVSPLGNLVTQSPGNMALAATRDLEGTCRLSRQIALDLRMLGFNVNFSPVADVNTNPKNPIIGIRSFGENPGMVSKFADAVIRGYQEEGVMATAKHFPGHGDTEKDSHLELPSVHRRKEELNKIDLLPFKRAVQHGVWGIMTAHVVYTQVDGKPATLSPVFLTEILRKQWKFNGIVFTDSFEMAAMKKHFDLEEAVLGSVKAGADILLALGGTSTQLEILEILKKAIEKKRLSDEHVITPLKRILLFKEKLALFKPLPFRFNQDLSRKLHERSITLLKGKELLPLPGKLEIFLSPFATPHKTTFQAAFKNSNFHPWPWRNPLQTNGAKKFLFLGETRILPPEVRSSLEKLKPILDGVVSFGSPYFLAELFSVPIQIAGYHLNEITIGKVFRILIEGESAEGKLPVTL